MPHEGLSMSESEIYVNYGRVDNVEMALADATMAIATILDELQNAIQPLRATWAGVSETEYEGVQQRFNIDLAEMMGTLGQNNDVLSEMKINYSNTDTGLALQWQDITLPPASS
jgi:WXG100 family type VII secretion target